MFCTVGSRMQTAAAAAAWEKEGEGLDVILSFSLSCAHLACESHSHLLPGMLSVRGCPCGGGGVRTSRKQPCPSLRFLSAELIRSHSACHMQVGTDACHMHIALTDGEMLIILLKITQEYYYYLRKVGVVILHYWLLLFLLTTSIFAIWSGPKGVSAFFL